MKQSQLLIERILVIILLFFFSLSAFAWDEKDDELLQKIIDTASEIELREVYQKNKERVTKDFLITIADQSFQYAKQGGQNIDIGILLATKMVIVSNLAKLDSSKARAFLQLGRIYQYFKSDNVNATKYFELSLEVYYYLKDILGEANCIIGLGEIAFQRSDNGKAEELYTAAIPLYQKVSNIQGEANCIVSLGNIAFQTGNNAKAEKLYNEAIPLFRKVGDILGEANCIIGLGEIAFQTSDNAKAEELFTAAIPLYQKVSNIQGEANCIVSLGQIAFQTSDNAKAEKLFNAAIPLYQKAGSIVGEANCIKSLGNIAFTTSDNAKAEKLYNAAIPLYQKAGSIVGEANCIKSLGDIAFTISDNAKAEKLYNAAIPLYQKAGSIVGEATCISSLGDIAFRTSDNAKAEKLYQAAIPLYQKVGSVVGEATCIHGLGNIAFRTNDNAKAEKLYNEAIPLYRKTGDILGEANCIYGLGNIALYTSNSAKAEKLYNAANPLYRKVGSILGEANCIRRLGNIAFYISDNAKAEKLYQSAYKFYQQINDSYSQFYTTVFLSVTSLRLQKIFEAKDYLQKALEYSQHVRGKSGTASDRMRYQESIGGHMKTTISDMGKVDKEFALHIWENFRGRTFLEGISTSMALDISVIEQADKDKYTQLNEEKNRIFAELQSLSAQKSSWMERRRFTKDEEDNKETDEKIAELEKQINSKRELLREVEKKVDEFEEKLAEKNERFRNLRRPNIPSVSELQKTLTEEEVALVYLDANIYKTEKENIGGPGVWVVEKEKLEFIPLSYSADPKKGNELIEWIGKYRDLVQLAAPSLSQAKHKMELETKLSEILLSKPLAKISSGKKNLILIPDGVLGTLPFDILPYRNGILSESFTISYSPSLSILHLLRSKERDYSGLKRIPLLAFGGAHYTSGKGFQDKEDEKKESLAFLDVGQREARLNSYLRSGFREGKLTDLPGAREETKSIGKIYYEDEKQRDAALFFGAWASEPVLKSLNDKSTFTASRKKISDKETTLEDVRILHFSVHGEAMSDFPETSRIILSLPSQTPKEEKLKMENDFPKYKNEDGSLLAAEIVGLRLKSDLVVMSACETGLGKVSSTEGIIGLTQSWMIAGSNGVVVSLWKVSDIGSRVFMTIFHEKIAKGISPKIAIKETRDIIRKNEWRKGEFASDRTYKNGRNTFKDLDLSSPFFWSAFQYWGK